MQVGGNFSNMQGVGNGNNMHVTGNFSNMLSGGISAIRGRRLQLASEASDGPITNFSNEKMCMGRWLQQLASKASDGQLTNFCIKGL